jgi:hypothetical protein
MEPLNAATIGNHIFAECPVVAKGEGHLVTSVQLLDSAIGVPHQIDGCIAS